TRDVAKPRGEDPFFIDARVADRDGTVVTLQLENEPVGTEDLQLGIDDGKFSLYGFPAEKVGIAFQGIEILHLGAFFQAFHREDLVLAAVLLLDVLHVGPPDLFHGAVGKDGPGAHVDDIRAVVEAEIYFVERFDAVVVHYLYDLMNSPVFADLILGQVDVFDPSLIQEDDGRLLTVTGVRLVENGFGGPVLMNDGLGSCRKGQQ